MPCFNAWDIGACGCTAATMTVTVHPYGCVYPPNNAALFSGITVNIYDHSGGTLLASGSTGGSGSVVLTWTGSGGTYYITIPAPNARWTNYGSNQALANGSAYNLQMPTNTGGGYSCVCSLDIPIKTTGWTYTDANGSHPLVISSCTANISPFPYGYITGYTVSPNAMSSPTACVGSTTTKIFGVVTIAQTFVINRLYYVASSHLLCYCDTTSCGVGGHAVVQSATSVLSSIAIPISMTVTPSAVPGTYAPDPVGGNITVTE